MTHRNRPIPANRTRAARSLARRSGEYVYTRSGQIERVYSEPSAATPTLARIVLVKRAA